MPYKKTAKKTALILAISFLFLSGCVVVRDFAEYWNKGTIDPALEGKWIDKDGATIVFEKKDDLYELDFSKKDEKIEGARTLKVGRAKMLMVKENLRNRSGTLNLYMIEGDKLIFYVPAEKQRQAFINDYRSPEFRIHRNSVEIYKLTPSVFDILLKITQRPEYWESNRIYSKVKLEN